MKFSIDFICSFIRLFIKIVIFAVFLERVGTPGAVLLCQTVKHGWLKIDLMIESICEPNIYLPKG